MPLSILSLNTPPAGMSRALQDLTFTDLNRTLERHLAYHRAGIPIAERITHDRTALILELARRALDETEKTAVPFVAAE